MLESERLRAEISAMRRRHKDEAQPLTHALRIALQREKRKGHKRGPISDFDRKLIREGGIYTNDPKLLAAGAQPYAPGELEEIQAREQRRRQEEYELDNAAEMEDQE